MGDFTYAEKADMHYMYGRANGNGRAALRMYRAEYPDRRMPGIFERVRQSLQRRCQACIDTGGRNFEHLL